MRQNKTKNASKSFRTLAITLALAAGITQNALADIKIGDSFPALSSFSLVGKQPDLSGRVVLVDFWASWCGPCKKSFPAMNSLQKKYANKGLVIVAISVDDRRGDFDDFLKKTPAAFAVLWDSKQALVNKVDVHTMPSSFILDQSGKVRFAHSGFEGEQTGREYESEIESLIRK